MGPAFSSILGRWLFVHPQWRRACNVKALQNAVIWLKRNVSENSVLVCENECQPFL